MSHQSLLINGLRFRFVFDPTQPVKILDETFTPWAEDGFTEKLLKWARLVEIQATGFDQDDHHGLKYTGTCPAGSLRYDDHSLVTNDLGPKLTIIQKGGGIAVTSHWQFLENLPIFRAWTVVENIGAEAILLEYVSTFALAGISRSPGNIPWDETMRLHIADNAWGGEFQWRTGHLPDFGFHRVYSRKCGFGFSVNRFAVSNLGTWSTLGHLPLGALENTATGTTLVWQIEHNGSWHWEVSDIAYELYLQLSGPTYREGHWRKLLPPGERFQSVPATVGLTQGDLSAGLRLLTTARRLIRRPHSDMEKLPVIFNDYMNCLMGDPTSELLWPLIERAADVGSEYFVIDAGWYAEKNQVWWDTVGEWQESHTRFPGGLRAVIDRIREHGMIPGLWLEVEVMGVNCPLAQTVPNDWFFQRDGCRVIDHGRYQLDFRNPAVRVHASAIIDRLIRDYGIGYLKMDYNIDAGTGTDYQADSVGDGLLEHNRAYLTWITEIMDRHPDLVIENCGSGGLRADYANLSLNTLQSTSDQMDYRLTAIIAAASASAVTPEQAAVWSYPLSTSSIEETICNMVNALLSRVHQSGEIGNLSAEQLALVKEGIAVYKTLREDIPRSLPFWPLGLPRFGTEWAAYGLENDQCSYLAIWRLRGENPTLSLPRLFPRRSQVEVVYPATLPTDWKIEEASGDFSITLPQLYSARLLRAESVCDALGNRTQEI